MSEVNDFQFKVILQCEQYKFNPTRYKYCEYLVEMNGVERPLRNILKENIEQQGTITALKERLYDFEKRKIIEESEIDEDVIPKVKLLRAELFGEKYE